MSSALDNTSTSPRTDLPMPPIIIHDEHTPARRFSAVWLPGPLDQRTLWQDLEWESVADSVYDYLESIFQCGIPVRLWQEYAENMRQTPVAFNGDDLASIVRGYAASRTIHGVCVAHMWDDVLGDVALDYVKEFLTWCVTYMAPVDMSTYDFNEELVDAWMFSHDQLEEFLLLSFTSLIVYAGADVLFTPLLVYPNTNAKQTPDEPWMCVNVRITITPLQIPEEEDD